MVSAGSSKSAGLAAMLLVMTLWQEVKTAASAPSQPEIPRCQQLFEIFTTTKFALKTNRNADNQSLLISLLKTQFYFPFFLPAPKELGLDAVSWIRLTPESSLALSPTPAAELHAVGAPSPVYMCLSLRSQGWKGEQLNPHLVVRGYPAQSVKTEV